MPRLLHLIPSMNAATGGPPVVVHQLVRRDKANGWTSSLLTIASASDADSLDSIDSDQFEETGTLRAPRRFHELWPGRPTLQRLRLAIQSADIVMVHGLWHPMFSWGARFSRGTRIPYVVMPHGMLGEFPLATKAMSKRAGLVLFERKTLREAAALIFTTAEEEAAARSAVSDLPPGVMMPLAAAPMPDTSADTFLRAYPSAEGKRIILFLGRVHPIKGVDRVIHALPAALSVEKNAMLVVAGPGEPAYLAELRRQADSIGVSDHILWAGPLYEEMKAAAYAASEMFVSPSRHENFGISVAEALSAAIPAITSDGIKMAASIREANAGVVLSEADIDQTLGAAMARLLADPLEARSIGERGRAFANERFSWDRSAAVFYGAVDGILDRGR